MVEPVDERLARDADAEFAHIGEIGKPEPAGDMALLEHDVPLRPIQRPPFADAPFQCAAHARGDLRMAA